MPAKGPPKAYSYIRFSTTRQEKGDSLRRQTEATSAWCERNGLQLDTTYEQKKKGRSAFKGRQRDDKAELGRFIKEVNEGRIARGSYLVIENLDRLSREEILPALTLLLNLVQAGIRIVQLFPAEIVYDDKVNPMTLVMAIMELSRGHSESRVKSERIRAAWQGMRQRARDGQRQQRKDGRITDAISGRLPGWIRERRGRLELIPERAAIIRKIFKWAAEGYGYVAIIQRLTDNGTPAIGYDKENWSRTSLCRIINDRRAIGEYQPRRADRSKDGPVMKSYYPAAVTTAQYYAARAAIGLRAKKAGSNNRVGKSRSVNVFVGLLKDMDGGGSYIMVPRLIGKKGQRRRTEVLVNSAGVDGRATMSSFPYGVFERAILSQLAELKPKDVAPADATPDSIRDAENELTFTRERIAELKGELMRGGPSTTIGDAVRELEGREVELAARVDEEKENAAVPPAESWRTAQKLIDILDGAKDKTDVRVRLRLALRRVVEAIEVKFVGHGRDRLAVVKVRFKEGMVRGYVIIQRPPVENRHARKAGGWWALSQKGAHIHAWGKGGKMVVPSRRPVPEEFLEWFANVDGVTSGKIP